MTWALGSLCQLYRLPFSPDLLQQQFPPPYDKATLLGAAKALDFKIGEKAVNALELSRRMKGWISSGCGGKRHRIGGKKSWGRVSLKFPWRRTGV
jgi:hypothetical protein